jgi:hypothetical protein
MRWPLVVAAPFGLFVFEAVRRALWLPFVVVDGTGARAGLRASRETVRSRWPQTARPFAAVGAATAVCIGIVVAMSAAGVATAATRRRRSSTT